MSTVPRRARVDRIFWLEWIRSAFSGWAGPTTSTDPRIAQGIR